MFQPANPSDRNRRVLMAGAALLAVIVIAGIVVLLLRGRATTQPTPTGTPTPAPQAQLQGSFTKTTMTCPGAKEIAGDTCLIKVHLTGTAHINVTWTGPALVALGVRDAAGKDVGPQVTGEKGKAVFDAANLKDGDYQLRVVDVTHPADPFTFTVDVTTA